MQNPEHIRAAQKARAALNNALVKHTRFNAALKKLEDAILYPTDNRLIWVVGPSGVGKTRLLQETEKVICKIVAKQSYCRHFRAEQRQVDILLVEAPAGSLSEDERAVGARLNTEGKLTKSFLLRLPIGCFLASQDLTPDFEPLFAESIENIEARSAQWERIRAAGVNQRACHVFPSRGHFEQWQQDARAYVRARAG